LDNSQQLIAEMAWCALTSLAIAQQNGECGYNGMQEHKFLSQWLTTVYKQKRFSREVAADLEELISLAKTKGQFAKLKQLLQELHAPKSE
jgi:hypothetical protein